jgi:hypothetical protein
MSMLLKTVLCTAAALLYLAAPAQANACAADLKAVDAALVSAKLDPASLKKVQDLRALGEKAVADNKPADCLKTIGEAKKMLGLK